ncbi:MAG: hypothetical protein GY841_10335 [FCB group bacterium]|nr:hypothetical protein [FCB group bacterium]
MSETKTEYNAGMEVAQLTAELEKLRAENAQLRIIADHYVAAYLYIDTQAAAQSARAFLLGRPKPGAGNGQGDG